MIKSFYLRLFYLGLPGLYIALWLSRFSLSMVNAMPYYYGMIMTAISLFAGVLIGITIYNPFRRFLQKNYPALTLACFTFINIGHVFNWMDAGINAKYEIIYYFSGLCLIGFICLTLLQLKQPKEKTTILIALFSGSVLSYFIGVKYFEQAHLDVILGIPVFIIAILEQIFICEQRSAKKICATILLTAINIVIVFIIRQQPANFDDITSLGYTKLKINKDNVSIINHRQQVISDIKNKSLLNAADLPVYQLQTNKNRNRVLFVGYPGSMTPALLYRSPFVEKLDLYFWDITVPKTFPKASISPHDFYISEWDIYKKYKTRKYDLIIIENIPEASESGRRIFLHYAKKLLTQPHGVIAYPESLARKYDGQYIKVTSDSTLVMLMNSESTEDTVELEKRYNKFLNERTNIPEDFRSKRNIPVKMITSFDTTNSVSSSLQIQTILPPKAVKTILWIGLGIYLIFRLFKCRYKNNQNGFFAFETGFCFSIVTFSSLMLLSELRLVYPYFTPALFGMSVLLLFPVRNKKAAFFLQIILLLLLLYFTSINFVRALSPIYILPIVLPLCFCAFATTLENCKVRDHSNIINHQYIFFVIGILFTLILIIFAKNNDLYPTLIYISIISRFLYYLKI